MADLINRFDSAHVGPLHDIQVDYYSTKLATASSDRAIRIWDLTKDTPSFLTELRGHDGPVWQLCWAHPQFGSLLASCGYDKRIIIWQNQHSEGQHRAPQQQQYHFSPIYINEDHAASVNSISFAPWELGLGVAAGSTDGSISILWHRGSNQWERDNFSAHFNGVNAVSWAPPSQAAMLLQGGKSEDLIDGAAKNGSKLIASGGCDNQVRIWAKNEQTQQWQEVAKLNENSHTDWVRDVAFQPSSIPSSLLGGTLLLASCSEDKTIKLWRGEGSETVGNLCSWKCIQTIDVDAPVWRLSWSISGTILSAACGDADVFLFRECLNGQWEKVSNLSEASDPHHTMPEGSNLDALNALGSKPAQDALSNEQTHQAYGSPHQNPNLSSQSISASMHPPSSMGGSMQQRSQICPPAPQPPSQIQPPFANQSSPHAGVLPPVSLSTSSKPIPQQQMVSTSPFHGTPQTPPPSMQQIPPSVGSHSIPGKSPAQNSHTFPFPAAHSGVNSSLPPMGVHSAVSAFPANVPSQYAPPSSLPPTSFPPHQFSQGSQNFHAGSNASLYQHPRQ